MCALCVEAIMHLKQNFFGECSLTRGIAETWDANVESYELVCVSQHMWDNGLLLSYVVLIPLYIFDGG